MPLPADSPLARTWPLTLPTRDAAAVRALPSPLDRAAVEALVELVAADPSARLVTQAIARLEESRSPIVRDALAGALDSPHATVRLVAVRSLARRGAGDLE